MAVFDIFARERRELSNSEMARLLGVAETSCLDLLHTLVKSGYLTRTARTRRFYPTGRLMTAARKISKNDPLFAIGSEATELLTDKTGETALSGRMERSAVTIIALCEGRHVLRYMLTAGDRIASYASGLGKALLAAMPDDEVSEHLAKYPPKQLTEHTLTDVAALKRDLELTRSRGWAMADSEGNDGVSSLAVAGFVGEECLAVSLSGPSKRIHDNRERYIEALREVQVSVFAQEKVADWS